MTSPPTPPSVSLAAAKVPRPTFLTFLSQVEDGVLAANATEELETLVRELRSLSQVANTKPVGSITITLRIAALPGGEMMNVVGESKVKLPRRPKTHSLFWRTKEDCLAAQSPHQLGIPGLDVTPTTRPRVVD